MKDLSIIFGHISEMLEKTSNDRKEWHKKEQTLAKLLKNAQLKDMLPITSKIFKEVGLPTNGKLTQTNFLSNYCKHFVEKKGINYPAYVNKSTIWEKTKDGKIKTDKDGKRVAKTDKDGNVMYNYKLTIIKDGSWTLEKLLKSCTE